jgi:hypothetical protein
MVAKVVVMALPIAVKPEPLGAPRREADGVAILGVAVEIGDYHHIVAEATLGAYLHNIGDGNAARMLLGNLVITPLKQAPTPNC